MILFEQAAVSELFRHRTDVVRREWILSGVVPVTEWVARDGAFLPRKITRHDPPCVVRTAAPFWQRIAEWVEAIKGAGAQYVLPVAKHHDGFAMFKSAISHWNAAEMGPKRDIVGELAQEIRAQGLRLQALGLDGNKAKVLISFAMEKIHKHHYV